MTKFSDNPSPSLLMAEHVDPSNPSAGYQRLFVDTDHILKMVDSSGTVTTFGTGLADPMTTRGDIIVRNAANATARLPIGSSGKVLSSDGTDVSWATPAGGGAMALLSSTVLGSAAADITVTGISGSYKDLIVVCRFRSTNAGAGLGAQFRVGAGSVDSGSNYLFYENFIGWATGNNNNGSGANEVSFAICPNSGAAAGAFGYAEITIMNYADTAKVKGFIGQSFSYDGSGIIRTEFGGAWKNTSAAMDQFFMKASAGNLDTGSAVTIYGRG